ncbi:hypothetical protein FOA22_03300 [Heyndrickxia oleronia]|uniref:hypothetical protein n=1 Tax=Heyndrickxia oleronia TaxID=38875 RepID=UPI0007171174
MLIKKGSSLSCRLPNDTSTEVIDYLNKIKTSENRKFSSTLASFIINRIKEEIRSQETKQITFELPESITESQLQFLNNPSNQKFIISILLNSLNHKTENTNSIAIPKEQSTSIARKTLSESKEKIEDSTANYIFNTFLESP